MVIAVSLIDCLTNEKIQDIVLSEVFTAKTDNPFAGICFQASENTHVIINHEDVLCELQDGYSKIPCVFSPETAVCQIEIAGSSIMVQYTPKNENLKMAEKAGLYQDFAKISSQHLPSEIEDYVQLLSGGTIPLVSYDYALQTGEQQDILFDIEKVAREDIRSILAKPHMQLVESEQIERIERVSRYNSHSLRHLATHSEFWHGKKLNGVYPEKMLSLAYEDHFDNYENLFFRMAVDKMGEALTKDCHRSRENFSAELSNAILKENNESIEHVPSDQIKRNAWADLCPLMPPSSLSSAQILQNQKSREDVQAKISEIISQVKSHKIYEALRSKNDLPLPIQMTNALAKKENYNHVYSLWEKLIAEDLEDIGKNVGIGEGGTNKMLRQDYATYVFSAIAWAIKKLQGFNNNKLEGGISKDDSSMNLFTTIDSYCVSFNGCWNSWTIPYAELKISIPEEKTITLKEKEISSLRKSPIEGLSINNKSNCVSIVLPQSPACKKRIESQIKIRQEKSLERIISLLSDKPAKCFCIGIVPVFTSPPQDETAFRSWIIQQLNTLSNWGKNRFDSILFVYPLSSTDLDELPGVPNRGIIHHFGTVQYAINYGNEFCDKAFGDYRFAVLPISRDELKAPLRFVKYLQMHLCRLHLEWENPIEKCPVCGSKNISAHRDSCYDCEAMWNLKRQCPNCHNERPWIRLTKKAKKHLEENAISLLQSQSPIKQMENKEMLLEYSVVTGYEYPNKYSCPICGKSDEEQGEN